MKDDSWSWSKPDNVPRLAGRKKVDKTLIETGTTAIPIEFHEEFPTVEKIKQQKLQNATSHYIITLIYEGKRYEGRFARKSTGRIFICVVDRELKEKIKAAFVNSSTLINEKRKELMTQKKYVIVPDELAEYVEYYLTNELDTYEIKLVTNEAMRITVDNMKENVSKQTISDTRDELDCRASHLLKKIFAN